MDTRYWVYWIFFVLSIATTVTYSSQTNPQTEYPSNEERNFTVACKILCKDSLTSNRPKREAPPEFTIIKHKSRPSKHRPSYRSRRRPKPKPVYGPPNFSYGSPISDYTLGYTTQGKKTKNGATSIFSNSNLDTQYETDFAPSLNTNLYSGHNSYESTFKGSGNAYISPPSSGLLPSLPIVNYGSDATLSFTPPPQETYSNQGYKHFGEPPKLPKIHDLTGSGTHNVKSIPPSTNYGVPVVQIHQQNQPQNIQTSNNQHQDSYISNLYNSFSTPTQSQNFNKLPNLQSTYTNNPILSNAGIVGIGLNAAAGISQNSGNSNSGNANAGTFNSGSYNSGNYNSVKFNSGSINNGISPSDPSFNQNTLNSLTYNTYATSQPPQVNYVPSSVTISSSKEITLNRKPSSGKFAEPPANYVNSYQPPITSYDVPIQHDPSKTTYNVDAPENQFQPTIYKSPQNTWNQSPSTTTERHRYLPPTLPTAYDNNQFNSFSRETDYSSNYNQHTDFLDTDGDYGSIFEVRHESKKIPKTKLTKTYAGTNLKTEDSSIESVEIPSDEYVDELISAPTTKKPRTRRRRPRPTVPSTTPHILDTEDLRDAFSSGTVQYSLAVNPNEKSSKSSAKSQSKVAKDKNFVLLSAANTNRNWSRQYPKRPEPSFDPINDVKEFLQNDSSGKANSSNNGIEILSIQKSKSHSYYAGTVAPPRSFKEKGISARYDQPKYDDSMFNVVSTNVRMANKNKSSSHLTTTGSRRTKKQNFEESKEVEDAAASKDIDPIFWNGHKLPDNHKLAKRVA
ncbi:uncharacterized protein LOC119066564 [Bradysia coprophila]|uniref:uncharacterized protein LOC119066564 n=1 Tax=Bradysia coprophila TaxID=38358 RepID=UPI00187DAAB4|nr:uncharacterized protein LOC119066564 [Bradysia coprophila]